jgi:HD-GYP domain-containing protein (c-di-GMP phosphodiesterase class II)
MTSSLPLRILVIGGDASVWVGLSSTMGSRASQIFVPPEVDIHSLMTSASDIDVVVVVAQAHDPDPCAPLRLLQEVGLNARTVMLATGDDGRTATEATSYGIAGYVVKGSDPQRVATAISQVAEGGVFFDAPAATAAISRRPGQAPASVGSMSAARALATALELKDTYTGGHAERVTALAMRLAHAAQLDEAPVSDALEAAFLLHDVGKIGIPESILGKPGRLTDTERRVLQTHPILGERVVAPLGFPDCVRQVVRHHHERWDGRGYPDGLTGTEIPGPARIFSIADVIDAMTSFRPYRAPMSLEEAVREILKNAGTQFDPALSALAEEVFLGETIDLLETVALPKLQS